ncbi:MAG: hypothetical protein KAH04_02270 [Psychrilyobacter sp.]|nr:hypothetical protein [Psychrilyobacter sp.]
MRRIDYYREYLGKLNEFLGVDFKLKAHGSQVEFISKFNSKFIKKTLEETGEFFEIISIILESYYEENRNIYFSDIVEEFSQKAIGHLITGKLEVTREQIYFMEAIKKICNETYESQNSSLNMLIFKDIKTIEADLKKIGIDFLPSNSLKNIDEIFKEKMSLKMLNGEEIVLIIGNDFKVYGLGVNVETTTTFKERIIIKLKEQNNEYVIKFISKISQNIKEYIDHTEFESGLKITEDQIDKLANYSNEKMVSTGLFSQNYKMKRETKLPYVYMEVKNKELKIHLQNSIDNYLSYNSGMWKLKSLRVFKFLILEKFYMDSFIYHLFNDKIKSEEIITNIIYNIDVLVSIIKSFLEDGKGGMFVILKRTITDEKIEDIFIDANKIRSVYDKTVFKDGKKAQIKDHNFNYLKLISEVDGAVILDNELNLLSFGRLLKLDTEGTTEKVEGSRTAAAISGSKYGLAIKISEDKKIEVWENGIKVLEV